LGTIESSLPIAIVAVATFVVAAWCLIQGSIINASAEIEQKSSIWGVLLNVFGAFFMIVDLLFIIGIMFGGETTMIPESAWPLLMGALTMIGAGFAAALCIMVAAKAGAEMITQKSELSTWALLFIGLGEGLAIYGLIVAILLIST
jgi:V/A-type H+-transporting ATPase subunit K